MVDLSDGEKDNWDDGRLRWDDISIQLTWEEEEDEKVGEMVDKRDETIILLILMRWDMRWKWDKDSHHIMRFHIFLIQ